MSDHHHHHHHAAVLRVAAIPVILAILCIATESAVLQRPKRQWFPVFYWVPSYADYYWSYWDNWYNSYFCRFSYCEPAVAPMPRGGTVLSAEPAAAASPAATAAREPPATQLEAQHPPSSASVPEAAAAPQPAATSGFAARPPTGTENAAPPPPPPPETPHGRPLAGGSEAETETEVEPSEYSPSTGE